MAAQTSLPDAAALHPTTLRYPRLAGQTATVRQLQAEASAATGQRFGRPRASGPWLFRLLLRTTRKRAPALGEVFSAW